MRSRLPIGDVSAIAAKRPVSIRYEDFRDDGVYSITWSEGHTTTTVLSNPKFQVLAELAVEALCDRYHREAILTCASALDAYLDYHIEVTLRASGASKDHVTALLKEISRQAERRLGAFHSIEVAIGRRQPKYIEKAMIERRNEVVHKGYIPTEGEAAKYLSHVFEFVAARYGPLYREHRDTVMKIFFEKVAALPPSKVSGQSHPTMAISDVISALAFPERGDTCTFAIYVERIKAKKKTG